MGFETMPIELSTPVRRVSQDEFHVIDRVMLGHAFRIHNSHGRLLDETVYQAMLADKCASSGMRAAREVRVRVSHGAFSKDYRIDLLLEESVIVEIKTATCLSPAHRSQGLNYLLLADSAHGSLVNFRTPKVEREFLSAKARSWDRCRFEVRAVGWPDCVLHRKLRQAVVSLGGDIGLGLDKALYLEAIVSLLGLNRHPVEVMEGTSVVGHQEMPLLSPRVGLAVTTLKRTGECRRHLERLLWNIGLDAISWVNLVLGHARFEHLTKGSRH